MTTSSTSSTTFKPVPALQSRVTNRLADFPWWVLFIFLGGIFLLYNFLTNETYQRIISTLAEGIRLTIFVTLTAYVFSIILGLLTALGQLSKNTLVRNVALFYVQVVRGIPIIVQIFYVAFVVVPLAIEGLNGLGDWLASINMLAADNTLSNYSIRNVDFIARGIIALAISYGAFSSEIFRAGIQSIERGQIEASHALGLNWFKTMRLIVLPQAIRRVMPPLGNDFIAMLKESSLVSAIGVNEITQLGKKYAAASFLFPQTYNTVAFLYLSMTLVLSMGVKFMERRLKTERE
ncbi:MAG TPA: amino acid ABC transporter permease [Anaerolineales bacterium]|jgi:polar amino acid transport system permease protein